VTSPAKLPIQDTGSYSLDSPVQDILEDRPEMLKKFTEEMDKEDSWGNGWKRWVISQNGSLSFNSSVPLYMYMCS